MADDGSRVYGYGFDQDVGVAFFEWSEDSGAQAFPLPSEAFHPLAVSDDGSIVIGIISASVPALPSNPPLTFLWDRRSGEFQQLSPPDRSYVPTDISADGSAFVGTTCRLSFQEETEIGGPAHYFCDLSEVPTELFYWDRSVIPNRITRIPSDYGWLSAISSDGRVTVGTFQSEAFRWSTSGGGTETLGILPGMSYSAAAATTSDGSIIVGRSGVEFPRSETAFIWDSSHGMRDLRSVLADEYGLADELTGWTLSTADLISPNGKTIAGFGIDPSGETFVPWIARLHDSDIKIESATLLDQHTVEFTYATSGGPGEFEVGLFLSDDDQYDPDLDEQIGALITIDPSDGATTGQVELQLPDRFEGFVLVVADPEDDIEEDDDDPYNEDNVAAPFLDIRIVRAELTTPTTIEVTYNLRPTTGVVEEFEIQAYWSVDAKVDDNDVTASNIVPVSAVAGTNTVRVELGSYPPPYDPRIPPQEIHLIVGIEPDNKIAELDEENNADFVFPQTGQSHYGTPLQQGVIQFLPCINTNNYYPEIQQLTNPAAWEVEAQARLTRMNQFLGLGLGVRFGQRENNLGPSIVKGDRCGPDGEHARYEKMDIVPLLGTSWEQAALAAFQAGFWVHAEGAPLVGASGSSTPHLDLYNRDPYGAAVPASESIIYEVWSPAVVLVEDAAGRQSGIDASTGQTLAEIPGTILSEPGAHPQVVILPAAAGGRYFASVVGVDSGEYTLNVVTTHADGMIKATEFQDVTALGAQINYVVQFSPESADATTVIVAPSVQTVQIDIRPGDSQNTVNLANNGVIAVAIHSTVDFDARDVVINSVLFAGAHAVQSAQKDVNGDGRLDLVLNFRTQDTNLRALYELLLTEDVNADGILDSSRQSASLSLTGETVDEILIEGFDDLDLFLAGRALRNLLDQLAASGTI